MVNDSMMSIISNTSIDPDCSVHGLAKFSKDFQTPHGVLALIIASFGVLFNVINHVVLMHPRMRSPVNLLLTFVGGAEVCLQVIYIPFVIMFNLASPADFISETTTNIAAARYLLFYYDASVFLHLSAIWLILTTAFFRFLLVQFPIPAARWCTYKRAIIAAVCTIAASLLATLPNILRNTIGDIAPVINAEPNCYNLDPQLKYYAIMSTEYFSTPWRTVLNYWLYATVGKFIPCILLAVFTMFLIKILQEAEKRQLRLHNSTQRQSVASSQFTRNNSKSMMGSNGKATPETNSSKNTDYRQTTRMLLAVVVLFFVVELPHGILVLWAGLTNHMGEYYFLGGVIDLLTLTAFSVNFILYTAMSRQYRKLFISVVTKPFKLRKHYDSFQRRMSLSTTRRCSTLRTQTDHISMHSELQPLSQRKQEGKVQTLLTIDEPFTAQGRAADV